MRKCQEVHEAWDREVMQRIEYHVTRKRSHGPAPPQGIERRRLLPSDDPLKLGFHEERVEKEFQRVANSVLGPPPAWPLLDEEEEVSPRSRPVFPVEMWDQGKHF